MVNTFFDYLAQYYRQENDLSNITAIMCESVPSFKKLWLRFFFPDIDVDNVVEIIREQPDSKNGESRVDFYIRMENEQNYMIEVKIYDHNHHFGKYEIDYDIPKQRFGYITNYSHCQPGYDVKTWEQFYKYLLDAHIDDTIEKHLYTGYMTFLKNVCSINIIETPMRLSGLYSIYSFFSTISKFLNQEKPGYIVEPYPKNMIPKFYDSGTIYLGYKLKYRRSMEIFADFVIVFGDPDVEIWIHTQDYAANGNKKLMANLNRIDNIKDGVFFDNACLYSEPYDWNGYWFRLKPKHFAYLENSQSIDEQAEILESFFDEVNKFLVANG